MFIRMFFLLSWEEIVKEEDSVNLLNEGDLLDYVMRARQEKGLAEDLFTSFSTKRWKEEDSHLILLSMSFFSDPNLLIFFFSG
jgi:hypothetical protein